MAETSAAPAAKKEAPLPAGYVVKAGFVFHARPSGDFMAVCRAPGGKHAVEVLVTLLTGAAGELVVAGLKAGLKQLTATEFLAHLDSLKPKG
jgi:hypothetical protein